MPEVLIVTDHDAYCNQSRSVMRRSRSSGRGSLVKPKAHAAEAEFKTAGVSSEGMNTGTACTPMWRRPFNPDGIDVPTLKNLQSKFASSSPPHDIIYTHWHAVMKI